MRHRLTRKSRLAAAVAAVSLLAVACGDDDDAATTEAPAAATTAPDMPMTTPAMTDASGGDGAMAPSGPACGAVPTDGEGSFVGMADDPAATAASNNPALSTLVAAVTEAGLVDTLNGAGPFTIFAPVNDAFAAIPQADLEAVLADKELLTSILTYHVLPERLSSTELDGTFVTVNGADVQVATDAGALTINGDQATVVCQDIPTANATVYLIDTVLMPPA